MESIADRLRILRETWNESARSLSLELGVNPGAWNVWEKGSSLPSAEALLSLASRRVDVNWLLTGEGQPFRSENSSADVKQLLKMIDGHESQRLGISQLTLKASRATVTVKANILEFLSGLAPAAASVTDIVDSIGADSITVVLCLEELLRNGQVEEVVGEADFDLYRTSRKAYLNEGHTDSEAAAMVLDSITFLAKDVLFGITQDTHSTLLLNVCAGVPSGTQFLKGLQEYLQTAADGEHSAETDVVKLVIAAKVKRT